MTQDKPRPRTECSTCHKFWTKANPPRQAKQDRTTGEWDGDYTPRWAPNFNPQRLPDGGMQTRYFHVECEVDSEKERGRLILYQPVSVFASLIPEDQRGPVPLEDFRTGPDPIIPLHQRFEKKGRGA